MRGVRDEGRVNRQRAIIRRVLLRAKRKGWDEAFTAQVITASLSPARVNARVVGPCFYCFDELAATVDHVLPLSHGGTDDPWNLVSACLDCNYLKMTDHVDWFLNHHPFGKDKARNALVQRPTGDAWRTPAMTAFYAKQSLGWQDPTLDDVVDGLPPWLDEIPA